MAPTAGATTGEPKPVRAPNGVRQNHRVEPNPAGSTPEPKPLRRQIVVRFPRGVIDRRGQRVRPGARVVPLEGRYAGTVGEVVGWGGQRGVEILVHGEAPDVVAVPANRLEVVPAGLLRPVAWDITVIEEPPVSVTVIHPVGGQDIQPLDHNDLGPFPSPAGYESDRRGQRKVDARRWGEACVAAVADLADVEQARLVAAYLDAPLLRQVLDHAALPEAVTRLVPVVTDQDPPHLDDTAAYGRLLALWLQGCAGQRVRRVAEVAAPIVIPRAPHLLGPVLEAVRPHVHGTVGGCAEVVVVQAGGTPSMTFGVLLAYTLGSDGVPVRHVQVPHGGQLIEVDFPALVQRARAVEAARELLRRRDLPGARIVLAAIAGQEQVRTALKVVAVVGQLTAKRTLTPADIDAAATALHDPRVEQLRALAAQDQLRTALQLRAWEALAAWQLDDQSRFVSLLSSLFEHLPTHWFSSHGADPCDAQAVRAALDPFDWGGFPTCRQSLGAGVKLRKRLVRSRPVSEPATCQEIIRCVAFRNDCTCGLGRAKGAAQLRAAATAWKRYQASGLHELRNRSAHGLLPTAPGDVERALSKVGVRDGDVRGWLTAQLATFGLPLGEDVVGLLAEDARELLASVL